MALRGPPAESDERDEEAASLPAESATQPLVLLVDDNEGNLLAMREILSCLDARCLTARSGREALRYCLDEDFAVILLDVRMPDIDGFETARLIRTRESMRHTPILFLTAYDKTNADVERGYALGAVDYLFKPFEAPVLVGKVGVFLELHQHRERQRLLLERLARQAEDLERSTLDFAEFAHVAARDLAEPLRDLLDRVRALQEAPGADRDGTLAEHCGHMLESIARQRMLVDGLVEYASIDDTLEIRGDVDLTTVLNGVLVECASVLERGGASVTRDPLPTVRGDPRQLGRVFSYLLGNAVRFRGSAPPRIHVGAREDGDRWEISVSDNGVGFDARVASRLFAPPSGRRDRAARVERGIGLAICKRIVEAHRGTLRAQGTPGAGATFTFTLPVDGARDIA
jgi:signal transduction histidine kinase